MLRCQSHKMLTALVTALVFSFGCGDDGNSTVPDAMPGNVPDAMPGNGGMDAGSSDDAGAGSEFTLRGTVSVANASIEVRVGDTVIATTDADASGAYSVDVTVADDAVLHLRAHSGSDIVLAALLADVATLRARAGDDNILDASESSLTRITPISTSRYAAILAANGELPQNHAAVIAAEIALTSVTQTHDLFRMGSMLELIITDSSYELPSEYATTLALAEDLPALRALISDTRALRAGDPIGATLAEMMSRNDRLAVLRPSILPERYHIDLTQHANDFVGSGSNTLTFSAGGNAHFQPFHSLHAVLPPEDLTWEIADNQLITSREVDGTGVGSTLFLSAEQVAALYPDNPNLQNEIRNSLGSNSLSIERERVGADRKMVIAGVAVDHMWAAQRFRILSSGPLAEFGVTAPDVERIENVAGQTMLRSEFVEFTPFEPAMMTSTWVMQVALPSNRPLEGFPVDAGDLLMAHAFVTFADDGTATVTSGMLETPMTLSWSLLADGRLEFTFPDGGKQTVGIWFEQEHEYGFFSTYTSNGGDDHFEYWRAVPLDPSAAFSANLLVNQADGYWQSNINSGNSYLDTDGEFPAVNLFGYQFADSGLVARLQVAFPANPTEQPRPELNDIYQWEFADDDLHIVHTIGLLEPNRCNRFDIRCRDFSVRAWTPVAQTGTRLYVLEERTILADFNEMLFDEDELRWEINGEPADLSSRNYLIQPRLNSYSIADLPAIPEPGIRTR